MRFVCDCCNDITNIEADRMEIQGEKLMFPSPCGVWVVSNHS